MGRFKASPGKQFARHQLNQWLSTGGVGECAPIILATTWRSTNRSTTTQASLGIK
jgi:hypothetical protein